MSRDRIRAVVDKQFAINLQRLFPLQRSHYHRTKEINKLLEKLLYGKKGSIQDIFYIIIGIFAFAIVMLFVFKLISTFNDNAQGIDAMTSDGKAMSQTMTDFIPNAFDFGTLIFFIGLMIATLIFAMLVPVHPVFMVFYIIVMLIGIIFGGWISNSYEMITTNEMLASEASRFFWTGLLFRYLPWCVGVFSLVLMIVMYKVWGGQQQVNY